MSPEKNVVAENNYWNGFYNKFSIDVPSQFCVLLASEADKATPIVEFGCGNGRDAIYLSQHGYKVFAGDLSHEAIKRNKTRPHAGGAEFGVADVTKTSDISSMMDRAHAASSAEGGGVIVYTRFFLHTLSDEQERLFLTALSQAAQPGDRMYLEFRSLQDANLGHLFTGHYRRYVDTDKLVLSLKKEYGFSVTYERTGQGMAKYKKEDPFVSRIIAEKI